MLVANIILSNFPSLSFSDTVSSALQLMQDYDVQHMPVVTEDKFEGILAKEDLLELDQNASLSALKDSLLHLSVNDQDHIFSAVKLAGSHHLTVVPVINEVKEFAGVIINTDLVTALCTFLSVEEAGAVIVVEIDKRHFSFGEISRLVETNDAYITQLNTHMDKDTGLLQVTLKLNKFEVSDIIATFQRYDYSVKYYFGEEWYGNELKDNYHLLMTYLKM